jgi:hypothetical protein
MTIEEWRNASQTLNQSASIELQEHAKDTMRAGFKGVQDHEFMIMCVDMLAMMELRDRERYMSVLTAALVNEGILP